MYRLKLEQSRPGVDATCATLGTADSTGQVDPPWEWAQLAPLNQYVFGLEESEKRFCTWYIRSHVARLPVYCLEQTCSANIDSVTYRVASCTLYAQLVVFPARRVRGNGPITTLVGRINVAQLLTVSWKQNLQWRKSTSRFIPTAVRVVIIGYVVVSRMRSRRLYFVNGAYKCCDLAHIHFLVDKISLIKSLKMTSAVLWVILFVTVLAIHLEGKFPNTEILRSFHFVSHISFFQHKALKSVSRGECLLLEIYRIRNTIPHDTIQ